MKSEPQPSPQGLVRAARGVFLILSVPLLITWGGGVVHPVLDAVSVPGAWLAGLPAALGFVGFGTVVLCAGTAVARRARMHPRIPAWIVPITAAIAAVAALSVIVSGVASGRPASWLPLLLAAGLLVPRRDTDPWSIPAGATPELAVVLWAVAARLQPWGDGLIPEAMLERVVKALDALQPSLLPWVPGVVFLVVGIGLARRTRPSLRGAMIGLAVALVLERTFGFATHWPSAGALGALLGAFPMTFRFDRPLAHAAMPLVFGATLAGLQLGLAERWNCAAAEVAARGHQEYHWFTTEADGVSMVVIPSNIEAFVLLRRDGSIERLQSGAVTARAEASPPGGVLVRPPTPEMPFVRLVGTNDGLVVEWWDAATMQIVESRTVDVDCTPSGGTIEVDTRRVWAVCETTSAIALVPTGEADHEVWRPAHRPRHVELVGDALSIFFGGPRARSRVLRIPDLNDEVAERFLGAWSEGVDDSPRRVAVGRGPAGHLQVFGLPHHETSQGDSHADELATALSRPADSVRVGNWPGRPHRAQVGDRNRRWYESMWVTSPVDARATLVDLDVTWHQRSFPIGAPVRSVWVDPDDGTLFGMNRCGVFRLRSRTTFPWDP